MNRAAAGPQLDFFYFEPLFATLKARQSRLIALTAVGEAPGSGVKKPRSVQNKSLLPERNVAYSIRKRARRSVVRTSSGVCGFPNRLVAADLRLGPRG